MLDKVNKWVNFYHVLLIVVHGLGCDKNNALGIDIGLFKMFLRWVFASSINFSFQNTGMWRPNVECDDVAKCKQNQSSLSPFKRLSVGSDTQNGLQSHL